MAKNIMLLGTASGVGKSTVSSAICRYFTNKDIKTVPFKALNISLNSFVTEEGLEMGRAQVVQAEACKLIPHVDMNPILLKPAGNSKTQVIVNGKVYCNIDSYKYRTLTEELREKVKKTYEKVANNYELVVLEGSGSCAEINLKDNDIGNTHTAKMADAPVILVSDIDRGGVFASIVGTLMLLNEDERNRVKGVIINKFRGNLEYFKPAMKQLEDIIKIPVLGAMPYFQLDIEDEDGVTDKINNNVKENTVDIGIIRLPHMSNFTDFNSLNRVQGINIRYIKTKKDMKNPHIIIIPGTKNTIADLRWLKESGLFEEIKELKDKGTIIFGICGGYQILGNKISDPLGLEEGENEEEEGFGFLDINTIFNKEKTTKQTIGKIKTKGSFMKDSFDKTVKGYEIHNGISDIGKNSNIFIESEDGEIVGLCSKDFTVFGTYLHGVFDSLEFNEAFTKDLKSFYKINNDSNEKIEDYDKYKNDQYDKLAKLFEENIDIEKLRQIIGL